MDDETNSRVPRGSGDDATLDEDQTTKQPQDYTEEEVGRELIAFLSRLSPFRIQPSLSDHRSPGANR